MPVKFAKVRPVRDEEAVGSNPATLTQESAGQRAPDHPGGGPLTSLCVHCGSRVQQLRHVRLSQRLPGAQAGAGTRTPAIPSSPSSG